MRAFRIILLVALVITYLSTFDDKQKDRPNTAMFGVCGVLYLLSYITQFLVERLNY